MDIDLLRQNMVLGFQVMGYGLTGVFTALILFYIIINIITKIFPHKE